jgi:hypothetical protein
VGIALQKMGIITCFDTSRPGLTCYHNVVQSNLSSHDFHIFGATDAGTHGTPVNSNTLLREAIRDFFPAVVFGVHLERHPDSVEHI